MSKQFNLQDDPKKTEPIYFFIEIHKFNSSLSFFQDMK